MNAAYRGALELRAQGCAGEAAKELRADIDGWSRGEGRARQLQAVSTWGALGTTVAAGGVVALLTMHLGGPWPIRSERSQALLLLLAAAPTLQTVVASVAALLRSRSELPLVAEMLARVERVEGRPPPGEPDQLDPRAELRIDHVGFRYRGAEGGPGLDDITLTVGANESLAIVGPNGALKTTMLMLLLGCSRRTPARSATAPIASRRSHAGSARASPSSRSRRSSSRTPAVRAKYSRQRQQSPRCARPWKGSTSGIASSIARATRGVHSTSVSVSSRAAKRISSPRMLLREAEMLVLDEPEVNLDDASVLALKEILRDLARSRRVIAAVHDPRLRDFADRILELKPQASGGTHEA